MYGGSTLIISQCRSSLVWWLLGGLASVALAERDTGEPATRRPELGTKRGPERRPNVVFIFSDDHGFHDVGFRNPEVHTPRIDALARGGIILDQAYAQPLCTPSRSAFLTGRYPFTTGMQSNVLRAGSPYCLPTNLRILPEHLKEAGYKTHIVGKWHLGHCHQSCRPNKRGFDSFLGFMTGQETYFTKESVEYGNNMTFYDFWKDTVPYLDNTTYSMDIYRARVKEIVRSHDTSRPLFLYLTPPTPHGPIMVPEKYASRYNFVKNLERKTYLGMVSALDYFVGSVVDELQAARLYDNTVIIFSSDNGGQSLSPLPDLLPEHSGSNYPLRGTKGTVFEGGTRVTSFVHSPLLGRRGVVSKQLFHLVDWYPTILEMAGVNFDRSSLDGVSQLEALMRSPPKTAASSSRRNEIVYNIEYAAGPSAAGNFQFALRLGRYKLIAGGSGLPLPAAEGWFTPAEFKRPATTGDSCRIRLPNGNTTFACLFDLQGDPNERVNLYLTRQDVVSTIFERFRFHVNRFVPPLTKDPLPFNLVQKNGIQTVNFC